VSVYLRFVGSKHQNGKTPGMKSCIGSLVELVLDY